MLSESQGKMTKVLIVESNDDIFNKLRKKIGSCSRHVLKLDRTSGSCIENLKSAKCQAYLIYLSNNKESGRLQKLRSLIKLKSDKPVIVITENYQKNFGINLIEMGIDECIPADELSPNLLIRSIRHATQRKKDESRLAFLSTHDQLTGLANRFLLKQHLAHTISISKRTKTNFAVMLLDIDKFKLINDSLGHDFGDILLVTIAERLSDILRETDILARFGNDEFAILLENFGTEKNLEMIAKKVQRCLEKPMIIKGHELYITGSLGISTFPESGIDEDTILKSADSALYQAKKLGRNQFYFFNGNLNKQAQLKLELEKNLRRALINGEFEIYLQPQISPNTEEVAGAEALLRWQHPTRGLISPAIFIPILEDLGLLAGVEAWVLNKVCSLAKELTDEFGDMRFSVNISGAHFKTGNLKENVFLALQSSSLDANFLEVELTEDIMIEHVERNNRLLSELKELGISIALDDFGKGYSSLSYLKNFPADVLKIDKAFIDHLVEDKRDTAIVESLVELAHKLDIKVVAEGVEKKKQYRHLSELGCDFIQGYYFSKPIPISEFESFVAARQHLASTAATKSLVNHI